MTHSSILGIKTTNAALTVALATVVVMNVAKAPAQSPQMLDKLMAIKYRAELFISTGTSDSGEQIVLGQWALRSYQVVRSRRSLLSAPH
jgi:hypothetical protein